MNRSTLAFVALAAALAFPASSRASRGAPLDWGQRAASLHAPYADGRCDACHERRGPDPGPPAENTDALCLSCHEDARPHAHGFRTCRTCHNAHDSTRPHLLNADMQACAQCHGS